jgi:hypothetical protein
MKTLSLSYKGGIHEILSPLFYSSRSSSSSGIGLITQMSLSPLTIQHESAALLAAFFNCLFRLARNCSLDNFDFTLFGFPSTCVFTPGLSTILPQSSSQIISSQSNFPSNSIPKLLEACKDTKSQQDHSYIC